MKKANVWNDIIIPEGEMIIGKIKDGICKSREEFHNYTNSVYNWEISGVICDYVDLYCKIEGIDLPWAE